ncbi:MAG: hypothetical protein ACXWMU_04190 [Candidatus Limnocylindrales bacterium]
MTDASDTSDKTVDRSATTASPGEVRPASARLLDRPPSDRFGPPPRPPEVVATKAGRAVAGGLAGGLVAALLWLVIGGTLDLDAGLVVVAIVGGWLVGGGTALGAWGRADAAHVTGHIPWLAAALALFTWLAATFLLYLYAEVMLPASSLTLADRLASTPFTDWLAPQFLPLGPLEIVVLAGVSWWSAR